MKTKKTVGIRKWRLLFKPLPLFLLSVSCFSLVFSSSLRAQEKKPKLVSTRSVFNTPPSEYGRVGSTKLYASCGRDSYDILGEWQNSYYGATYGNNGYRVALKVDENSAQRVTCNQVNHFNGVDFYMKILQQSEFARVSFTIKNMSTTTKTVSLGIHGDIMIGNNDRAPIVKRIDDLGRDYGLTMLDGRGAQLCALFGASLNGVTAVDDYWFGYYYQNRDPEQMVGKYSQGSDWMQENGSYDSGMGLCWKNRTVSAGDSLVFSYLIGVGEVNLKPNSSFGVTPDHPDEWNNLNLPHSLKLEGTYESPLGVDGKIEYCVENDSTWLPLTDTLSSGSKFNSEILVNFDPSLLQHKIHFRTIDNVGNTNNLPPIVYTDVHAYEVKGIESLVYSGDSLYQQHLQYEFSDSVCVFDHYTNNVNVGKAFFNLSGVFPHTIGSKTYSFDIQPKPLPGSVNLANREFVYTGEPFTPEWSFTEAQNKALEENKDYTVRYVDNIYPGIGHLSVSGLGNYTSELVGDFLIDKAPLYDSLYQVTLPDRSTCADGLPHVPYVQKAEGVGDVLLSYVKDQVALPSGTLPMEEGHYDVYAQVNEGAYYHGKENLLLGSFDIYKFDQAELTALPLLLSEVEKMGGQLSWDLSGGVAALRGLEGVTISEGHVVALDLSNKQLQGEFTNGVLAFSQLQELDLSGNDLSGNLPQMLMEVYKGHSQNAEAMKRLNVSHNQYQGNVGIISSIYRNLESLDVSYNSFKDVMPLLDPKITNLVLLPQHLQYVVDLNLTRPNIEELAKQIPTIIIYNHEAHKYIPNVRLSCTPKHPTDSENPFSIQLMYADGQLSMPYVSEQKVYHGCSGDTIDVVNLHLDGTKEGSTFQFRLFFEKGDANFIKGIDAADLQATILFAFGEYAAYPFNFTAANTFENRNGAEEQINVQDVVCTINLLLSETPVEKTVRGTMVDDREMDAAIYIEDNQVKLRSARAVAALNLQTEGNITWDIERYGMSLSTLGGRMVGYSLNGATLPVGEIVIGHCEGAATLLQGSAADSQAQPLRIAVGEHHVTGVETLLEGNGELEIYDISGRRTEVLKKGVNIIRKNGKSQKQFILK